MDPRFQAAIDHFNERDFLEASDLFEDLFFESTGQEQERVRLFMQFAVGLHQVERGQFRGAAERLEEGLRVATAVGDCPGIDLGQLIADVQIAMERLSLGARSLDEPFPWPSIHGL